MVWSCIGVEIQKEELVVDGPLNDLEGLFESPTDEERVTILLNLMGREVKVRVPLETVYACT